tara:strand:+ start:2610 stop:2822 length:213 start_codon:yes stop_codon:yes gene_type:complete
MPKYSEDEKFILFESLDEINEYLENAHQRDLEKLSNDELEKEHIQYIETKKQQKLRLLGDKLLDQLSIND